MDGVHSWWRGVSPFLLNSNADGADGDLKVENALCSNALCASAWIMLTNFAHRFASDCTRECHLSLLPFWHKIYCTGIVFTSVEVNLGKKMSRRLFSIDHEGGQKPALLDQRLAALGQYRLPHLCCYALQAGHHMEGRAATADLWLSDW